MGCGLTIGAGTRYNALKTGDAKSYRFAFTCKECDAKLVVSTDPERADYLFQGELSETEANKSIVRLNGQLGEEERSGVAKLRALQKRLEDTEVVNRLVGKGRDEISEMEKLRKARGKFRAERERRMQSRKRGLSSVVLLDRDHVGQALGDVRVEMPVALDFVKPLIRPLLQSKSSLSALDSRKNPIVLISKNKRKTNVIM